jgi:hypothetical protein
MTRMPIDGQQKVPKADHHSKQPQSEKKPDTNAIPNPPALGNVINQQAPRSEENWTENHPKSYLSRLFAPENAINMGLLLVGS